MDHTAKAVVQRNGHADNIVCGVVHCPPKKVPVVQDALVSERRGLRLPSRPRGELNVDRLIARSRCLGKLAKFVQRSKGKHTLDDALNHDDVLERWHPRVSFNSGHSSCIIET